MLCPAPFHFGHSHYDQSLFKVDKLVEIPISPPLVGGDEGGTYLVEILAFSPSPQPFPIEGEGFFDFLENNQV